MRPYSLDLRERVAAVVDHHEGLIPKSGDAAGELS